MSPSDWDDRTTPEEWREREEDQRAEERYFAESDNDPACFDEDAA